ncbi:hypothetical protein [Streptomyces sp. NPDC056682]|uniref:hypothetical protein n=1 Tax=Streptomyces sp. NPDC056682 TaxID=3345909 RepID=UPI00369AE60C
MSTENITIPPETARHVLWHYGHDGGWQPGSFTQRLMAAFDAADIDNAGILATAYPELGAAMLAAKYDEDGIDRLKKIANGQAGEATAADPQCPEALYSPETDILRRCVEQDQHDWHRTAGGTQWQVPAGRTVEMPF